MCDVLAGVSTALQIGGEYIGQKAQYRQAQGLINAQAKAAITQMNYAYQNYEQERTDAFDDAVSEIMKTRQNALQLNSGVKAAVNEMAKGRTANMLVRNVEGDTARAVSSVKDNYARKSNEIDLNEDATFKSTSNYIDNLNATAPKMPGRFANFLSSANTILQNTTAVLNQKAAVESKGQQWDWWKGGAKPVNSTKTWIGNVPRSVHKKTGAGEGIYKLR
jgi:hypothetical protein